MAEGHDSDTWEQTSSIVAKLHNVNCSKRSQMVKPDQVNPIRAFEKRRAMLQQAEEVEQELGPDVAVGMVSMG